MFGRTSRADLHKTQAIDALSACVMIADESLKIVYLNPSVRDLLAEAEQDLRKDLPNFRVSELVGRNIDCFHKDPAHQRRMLEGLKAAHRATIQVAGRSFDLVATPVKGTDGKRCGIAVEWMDASIRLQNLNYAAQADAISRVQAVIEFNLDGTIVAANDNFLAALGYRLEEIVGKHHRMFVTQEEQSGPAYQEFWSRLNSGQFQSGEFRRVAKGGRDVWILASYNPVLDEKGKPFKVVKFATDVTAEKLRSADLGGQIAAIHKSQAVIEFNLDGTILTANENFQRTLGYSLAELQGRHHSMFVEDAERSGDSYRAFWAALNRGEYQAGEFKRVGRGGKEVWIQASYNPILDLDGKPFKVVKYASDITRQVLVRMGNEKVRGMMESVAAGSEELNASVREISEAMTKSRETATGAVERVASADQQAQRLTAAAQAMSGIVELIDNITGQINLLALNATIESARAGEAGRGFAVVASEVKSLANQAKQATDKIGQEIDNLNNISGDVVSALTTIKQAIDHVSEYVTSTAAAIEEQSTVTSEMSNSMQRAAAEAASIAAAAG